MNGSPDRGLVAAAAVFAVALLIFGSAIVRAIGTEPVPPAPPDRAVEDVDAERPAAYSAEAIQLAADHDPFRPDRRRPPVRYRMPGDPEPEREREPEPLPPPPDFVLHGTVVDPAGEASAVLLQVGEEPPMLMPMGSFLAGYRLTQIAPQAAVMSDGDRDLLLRVRGPQQFVEAEAEPRRGNERRRSSSREEQRAERERQQRERQLLQAIERARQSGASPQMIEALQRAIEQRNQAAGRGGGEREVIVFEANEVPPVPARNRVIIRRDTSETNTPRSLPEPGARQ